MRLSELTGHPVISTADAQELGRVDTVIVDPRDRSVRAYRLSGGNWCIPAESTKSVGADAVMVEGADVIVEPRDELEQRAVERNLQIIGSRALTDHGNGIGTVSDLEFDTHTGKVESLSIGSTVVPGDELIGVGTYAVVVRDPYTDDDQRR
jgi:sporulation protein YlmC with PRC-barrel domain